MRERAKSWSIWIFIAACGWWYWKQCWQAQMPDAGPSDFRFYYLAAQHVLHGRSPYLEGGYIYPPLLACLAVPLGALDYVTARWIWFAASHAAMLLAAYLLWRHLGRGRVALAVIAFVWAVGRAAEDGFAIGQVDGALVLLLVLTITASDRIASAAIAAGCGLKLFPGILAVLPALERKWVHAIAALIAGASMIAASWAVVALALKGPARPPHVSYLAGSPSLLNWSLPAVVLRAMEWTKGGGTLPSNWIWGYDLPRLQLSAVEGAVSLGVAAAAVAIGILALYRAVDGRLPASSRAVAGVALMSLGLAASPICWWHYQVLQYPGAAILLLTALRHARPWLFCSALVNAAFLFPIPAAVCRYYYRPHESWPNYPVTLYFWTAAPAAATVVLFILLTGVLRRAATRFHTSSRSTPT